MNDAAPLSRRSRASLLFENVLLSARRSGPVPRIADVEFSRIGRYAPWLARVLPDVEARTLTLVQLGARIVRLMGRDNMFVGRDYLELVDPAIKDGAFDSVVEMMRRPCGLWQMTPAIANSGAPFALEYTGYPVIDDAERMQIMFLVYHPIVTTVDRDAMPRPSQIQHSEVWSWLEMQANTAVA